MRRDSTPCERRDWCLLTATMAVVAAVWTILLPALGNRPGLRSSIERREALGVNANAMFYTELEAMETLVVNWGGMWDDRTTRP
jgi:hypothetical protein